MFLSNLHLFFVISVKDFMLRVNNHKKCCYCVSCCIGMESIETQCNNCYLDIGNLRILSFALTNCCFIRNLAEILVVVELIIFPVGLVQWLRNPKYNNNMSIWSVKEKIMQSFFFFNVNKPCFFYDQMCWIHNYCIAGVYTWSISYLAGVYRGLTFQCNSIRFSVINITYVDVCTIIDCIMHNARNDLRFSLGTI